MTEPEIERRLADVHETIERLHRTLKFASFLLAVLVLQDGGSLGAVVGGSAALLLVFDALSNVLDGDR